MCGHGGIQLFGPRRMEGVAHHGPHPRARSQLEAIRTSAKRLERLLAEAGIEPPAAATTTLRAAVIRPHSLRRIPTGVHLGVGLLLHLYGRMASSSRVGHGASLVPSLASLRGASGPLDPLVMPIQFGAHDAPPSTDASGTSELRTASPLKSSSTAPSASCSTAQSGP